MTVEAIRLENFMAFEDTDWLELRPITLLFGRNSSGKSAIIRSLLLLRQSLLHPHAESPLTFSSLYGIDLGNFREIVHQGEEERLIWFHFRCRGGNLRDILDRYGDPQTRIDDDTGIDLGLAFQAQRKIDPRDDESAFDSSRVEFAGLRISLHRSDPEEDVLLFEASYLDPKDVEIYGQDWAVQGLLVNGTEEKKWSDFVCYKGDTFLDVRFDLPSTDKPSGFRFLTSPERSKEISLYPTLRGIVETFLENTVHLGPIRPDPQRHYSFNSATALEWSERGWSAFIDFITGRFGVTEGEPEEEERGPRALVYNRHQEKSLDNLQQTAEVDSIDKIDRKEGDEIPKGDKINQWLRLLKLADSASPRRVTPEGSLVTEFEIGIKETQESPSFALSAMGFGTSQVLPVIVQCVVAAPGQQVILEQPELHLHPRAQAELGDLFISVAQQGVHCVIETHSEHLLLRLQKNIAKTTAGDFTNAGQNMTFLPDQLTVYFVDRRDGASTVSKIEVGPYGDLLNTPDGFEDFFGDDLIETAERMRTRLSMFRGKT